MGDDMAKMKEIFKIATLGMLAIIFSMIFLIGVTHATDYNIATCYDLQDIQNDVAGIYTLTSNIDCSDTINWNTGAGFLPIENFTGELHGEGFKIDRLFINRPSEISIGLIKSCPAFSTCSSLITEVALININYTCGAYCGAFAGYNGGTINKTYATGDIVGAFSAYAGGLVGINIGYVDNSWAQVNISAYQIKGGLLGYNGGTINNCYSIGWCGGDGGYGDRGGLCGMQVGGATTGTLYWNSDLFNSVYYAICSGGGANEYARNTTALQKKSTYVGWDFIGTWDICTRSNPQSYPILRSFEACCVASWSCNKYTACGNYHQDCLSVKDNNCGYIYDSILDGNLTQWGRNCSINAQAEDVGLQGFDLRYESNVLLLLVMIVAYIGVMAIAFAFHNPAFGFLGFLIGVGIGFIFMQVSPYLTLGFILLNILVFYNTSRGR